MYRNVEALPSANRHPSSSRHGHRQQGSRHGARIPRKSASRGGAGGLDGGTHFLADIRASSCDQNRAGASLMRHAVRRGRAPARTRLAPRAPRGRARRGARRARCVCVCGPPRARRTRPRERGAPVHEASRRSASAQCQLGLVGRRLSPGAGAPPEAAPPGGRRATRSCERTAMGTTSARRSMASSRATRTWSAWTLAASGVAISAT